MVCDHHFGVRKHTADISFLLSMTCMNFTTSDLVIMFTMSVGMFPMAFNVGRHLRETECGRKMLQIFKKKKKSLPQKHYKVFVFSFRRISHCTGTHMNIELYFNNT